jgi:predicted small metal-binding protein
MFIGIKSKYRKNEFLNLIIIKYYCVTLLSILRISLVCKETGLDCTYVISGDTIEEFITNGAIHIERDHGMHRDDFYFKEIPGIFLCQTFGKLNSKESLTKK